MGLGHATKYQLIHLKNGGTLNVREVPVISSETVVGKLPTNATGITIKHCQYNKRGQEWCYINYPLGSSHLEGWVKRYFLEPMRENTTSKVHITNFLHNYYMADEENFLDKLQVFYTYPMQQYMRAKNLTLMELRSHKVNFYKRWPKRDYRLTYLKILKRKPKYIDVQTTVRWTVQGAEEEGSGKDIQKIRLIPEKNTFKVLAIKNLKHIVFPKPQVIEEQNSTVAKGKEDIQELADNKNGKVVAKDPTQKYYIKVGSFVGTINSTYLTRISKNRFPYIIQKVKQGKNIIQRVLIGPFENSSEAQASLPKVRSKINANAYIQSMLR